ncbi:outer membrane biogenesis protein BamB [Novipirellula aureliae]|uniref:Outer membrane biogenesis protein BamB n=1 Tax=Novipirellula aureliae TaxID=2527966 RepID=A0A5C6E3F0_9BACT|nr:PQQ-binding-like beta-propeller repeat protein [Novipirellula aureliae]TWU43215.1 outer membrane biogenesis protein BamB [Novipirellula aureliae]
MSTELQKKSVPSFQTKRPRQAIVAASIAAILILLVQWAAPRFDHQIANFICYAIALIGMVVVAYRFHQFGVSVGKRWLVPLVALAGLLTFAGLYRFDGFSGEVMPQFKPRFWGDERMKPVAIQWNSDAETVSASVTAGERALESSLGFLGNDRTGVIAKRHFAIPTSAADVDVLWDHGIGEGWSAFAIEGDSAVTLEQRGATECVSCYRLGDGQLKWIVDAETRHENPLGGIGPRSTPTIHGNRVYALGGTGRLWCLDLETGEILWQADLLELAGWDQPTSEAAIVWGRAASPLLVDDLCIVPFGAPSGDGLAQPSELAKRGRSLIALDAESGDVRWAGGTDQISYASPVVMTLAGIRQVVSVNESSVSGHEIDGGGVLWSFDWPGQSNAAANCSSVVPAGDDQFIIGKGYGGGSALVRVTMTEDGDPTPLEAAAIWSSSRILKTKFTHACVLGDTAFALSDGSLQAVRIEDRKRLWQQPRSDRSAQGQILICEDTIVVQSEAGEVLFVDADPETYRVLCRLPALHSKTWNIPTVAGRHLLVRNDREVVCFLLPDRNVESTNK